MRPLVLLAAVAACAGFVDSAMAAIQASFSCSPSCGTTVGATVTFTSTSSSSAAIRDYAWDLDGDGLYGTQDAPDEPEGTAVTSSQRTFTAPGVFTIGLRVRNVTGEISVARSIVNVTAPGQGSPGFVPPPFVPPVAFGDDDRDRTPNERDLCPGAPGGPRARLKGCSWLDAVVSPAGLVQSVEGSIDRAAGALRRTKGAKRSLRRLTRGVALLELAAKQLPRGPCQGSSTAGMALRSAKKGLKGIGQAVEKGQKNVVLDATRAWRRRGRRLAGDADSFDVRFHSLSLKRGLAADALAELGGLRRLIGSACKSTKDRTAKVRERVRSLDTGSGLARLGDGTRLVFGAARKVDGLAAGAMVQAEGTLLAGKLLVADVVVAGGLDSKPAPRPCKFTPTIAPVQDFSQGYGDVLYYDERGYRAGFGSYLLERGMGMGAVRGEDCSKDDYALNVFLDYRNTAGAKVNKLLGVLRGYPGSEPPVRIPMDVGKKNATLRFELYGLDCELQGDIPLCGNEKLESKSAAPALIRKQGDWGKAVYDRDVFSVEDGSKTDFDTAVLADADAPLLPGASVFGVGYGIAGGKSQRPVRKYIVEGDQFAVHDDLPSQADPGGLLWAYLNGSRNGFPYHYVAKLPDIVTDVVSFCPNSIPSFYRLPWKPNRVQKVVQGNNNEPTHSGGQAFAFDFKMPKFTPGYATRGGLVTLVVENRTKQSNPKVVEFVDQLTGGKVNLWVPGNLLLVKHQDGTHSFYTHMVKNGVFPKKGDVVERGEVIFITGSTGNVTTPHLHYHVTATGELEDDSYGNTVPISFEVAVLPNTVPIPCYVPKRPELWTSTNKKPNS